MRGLLLGLLAAGFLAGCAGSATSRPGTTVQRIDRCTIRAIVTFRDGLRVRGDGELLEAGRSHGVDITVLREMGRGSRMVMINAAGPDETCTHALEQLRTDLRIESVQRL